MGNRGTNLYLSFKYGKAHRVDGSYYGRDRKGLKYYEPTISFVIKVYSVFLRNKEITLHPS